MGGCVLKRFMRLRPLNGFTMNKEIAFAISEVFSPGRQQQRPVRIPVPKFMMPVIAGVSRLDKKGSGIINRDKIRELKYSNWTCDSRRAGREIGFMPKITLKEGIKWTADWYRIHQWL